MPFDRRAPMGASLNASLRVSLSALAMALSTLCAGVAHAEPLAVRPPAGVAVDRALSKAPAGVTDLKFGEMFKSPVGPSGLEASDKLRGLVGQRVRMVGHVANASEPTPGLLILTPIPVTLGDEDEKLVDDLPPSAVFVHLSPAHAGKKVPNLGGLVQLTGTLELGAKEEADGHVSTTRLVLDDATSRKLARLADAQPARAPRRHAH